MSVSIGSMRYAFLGSLAAAIAVVGVATAADAPENVIKYRQNIMKSQLAHIGAIGAVVKGEVSYSGHVAAHARALQSTGSMLSDIFPEGSGAGKTRAKAEIWQDRAKFDAGIKAFQTAAGELVKIADSGDMAALGAGLKNVGKACGGCHKPFRAKKQ